MKIRLRQVGAALTALVVAGTLGACSQQGSTNESGVSDNSTTQSAAGDAAESAGGDAAAAPGEDAGFQENPLGDDIYLDNDRVKVGGVYFQPVDMEPQMGVPKEESSMHLEADIAAGENDLGYGVGDFIPGLTVTYKLYKAGTKDVVQEGAFMPMVANDGPHYGLNLPKLDAGTYDVEIAIESPEKDGWMLHVDKTTGVTGRYWTEPLVATFKNFQWDPTAVEW